MAVPGTCDTCCEPLCRTCVARLRTCSLCTLPNTLWKDSGWTGAATERAGGTSLFPECLPQEQPCVLLGAWKCPAAPLCSRWGSLCCGLTALIAGVRAQCPSIILWECPQTRSLAALERPEGDRQTSTSPTLCLFLHKHRTEAKRPPGNLL